MPYQPPRPPDDMRPPQGRRRPHRPRRRYHRPHRRHRPPAAPPAPAAPPCPPRSPAGCRPRPGSGRAAGLRTSPRPPPSSPVVGAGPAVVEGAARRLDRCPPGVRGPAGRLRPHPWTRRTRPRSSWWTTSSPPPRPRPAPAAPPRPPSSGWPGTRPPRPPRAGRRRWCRPPWPPRRRRGRRRHPRTRRPRPPPPVVPAAEQPAAAARPTDPTPTPTPTAPPPPVAGATPAPQAPTTQPATTAAPPTTAAATPTTAPPPTVQLSGPASVTVGVQATFSVSAQGAVRGTWTQDCSPPTPTEWAPGQNYQGTWTTGPCTLSLTVVNAGGRVGHGVGDVHGRHPTADGDDHRADEGPDRRLHHVDGRGVGRRHLGHVDRDVHGAGQPGLGAGTGLHGPVVRPRAVRAVPHRAGRRRPDGYGHRRLRGDGDGELRPGRRGRGPSCAPGPAGRPSTPRRCFQASRAWAAPVGGPVTGGRVGAEELHVGLLRLQVAQAVGHQLVGQVALEVDDEAVVAEALLGGPGLELVEVDGPGGELLEDGEQRAGRGRPAGRRRSRSCRGRWAAGTPPRGRRATKRVCSRGGPRCRGPAPRGRRAWRPAGADGRRGRSSLLGQTSRAASAVELAATISDAGQVVGQPGRGTGRWRPGSEHDRSMSAKPTPGGARGLSWMPRTTSRWMSRSCSKARASMVTLTVPSMEFSMATKPRSTSPASTVASTSAMVPIGHQLGRAARSGWVSRACSVKVPSGPRKPTRWRVARVRRRRSRGARILTWTRPPSGDCSTTCARAPSTPTTPWPSCAACPSPTSASPGSTTTAPCARAWPRRSTARARRPSSAPPSSPSC